MDPLTLAVIAAPFLAKGAEAFSKSAGEKLSAKVGELCQAVIDKFRGDSDAEETLALAQKRPDSKGRQSALEEILAEKLEADPDFAAKVQRLIDELGKDGTRTAFDQRGQILQGLQTNIDGSVQGPVLSGNFDGPVATGTGGEAVDLRGSKGAIYKPTIHREKLPVPRIPSPPEDFTGRGEELKEILKAFDQGASITGLWGTSGIGKTALALLLADKLKSRFRDGQIFLKLEGTSPNPLKPADAMSQVIRAFRGSDERLPNDQNELQGRYNSVLEGRRVLLLLDDAMDDQQVLPLLPPGGCAVLITSIKKFTLPGMPEPFSLDVMKPAEARDLLLWICPRIGGQADELAKLCGFLPLALRAAASLLAVNSVINPSGYLEELRSERTRLKKIGREGVERDAKACFDLSCSRLEPETAAIFGLLSIFPADFDAAAEEVICQDGGHRHLSELVRWDLVEYQKRGEEGEVRYYLHNLVRLFAAERLEEAGGEASRNEAQHRHSEYFKNILSFSTKLHRNGETLAGLERFDLEKMNIEAGWAWAKGNLMINDAAAALCNAFLDWP